MMWDFFSTPGATLPPVPPPPPPALFEALFGHVFSPALQLPPPPPPPPPPALGAFLLSVQSWIVQLLPDTWPPSADSVIANGPTIMTIVLTPIFMHVVAFSLERPSVEELESNQKQTARRIEVVNELIASLADEDLASDEIGRVKFEALLRRCYELLQAPRSAVPPGLMKDVIEWLGKLAEKELRIALEKSAQKPPPPEYADGSKLEKIIDQVGYIEQLMQTARERMEPALHKRVWALVYQGRALRRTERRRGLVKAVRLLLKARESLKWMLLQSVASILVATVEATTTYYRASVLDTFTTPDDATTTAEEYWLAFKRAAHALFYVEMLATLLGLLVTALRDRGQAKMGQELMVYYFGALLKKDLNFWTVKKGSPYETFRQVWELDGKIEKFVKVPQDAISIAVKIATSAMLVRQRSSRMLYLLLGINWGALALNYAWRFVRGKWYDFATRGLMEPSMDDFTWIHALNPEFVSTFQSFVRGDAERLSFARYLNSLTRRMKASALIDSFAEPFEEVLTLSSSIAQSAVTGNLVASGVVGVGQANGLMQSARGISRDTQSAISTYQDAVTKAVPLAKAWDLCTLPPSINPDVGIVPQGRARGHIIFEGVEFKYPDRDVLVLKGASFEVSPGQTLGMTGSAGCGKSTALRLLERFYDVTAGRILLDGTDIREYSPDWLRGQIATVAQEPKLLPCTILENITFGCKAGSEPTLEEVYAACKAANIYEQLMDKNKFPEGLRTMMNAVSNVSGGEKQRIAIARAILANPTILLLDEATSALDEENQEKVQSALERLMQGRTTLIIAHRLSTIRSASKIITFDNGKVVESGTHDELLQKTDGVYKKLWMKQAGPSGGGGGVPDGDDDAERASGAAHASLEFREDEVSQFNEPLTPSTRLGRLERKLSETTLRETGAYEVLANARAQLVAIVRELQVEANRKETERLETLLRQSEEVLLMSAPLHAWPSTFSRLGVRQQLLAPDDGTMHHLKRLVRKVVHENRDLRSELRSEADYEIAVPLPRRAQTVK
jgi:ABC-type dipeptide/oligopeptide/nickel transport system ATPase component